MPNIKGILNHLRLRDASNDVAYVVCIKGPDEGAAAQIGDDNPTVIGKSPECDLVLSLPTISKRHAQLTRLDNNEYFLIQDSSKNGTWLAGRKVDQLAIVKFGCPFQISADTLLVVPATGDLPPRLESDVAPFGTNSELIDNKFQTHITSGAHARVYRLDGREGSVVAKYLNRDGFCTPSYDCSETLIARIGFARSVSHPNCVRVVGEGVAGPNPYLLEEHVSGGSIKERLETNLTISARDIQTWIPELCSAISYLYERHDVCAFIDLDPSGLLIDSNNHLKLIHYTAVAISGMSYHPVVPRYWKGVVDAEMIELPSWRVDQTLIGLIAWEMAVRKPVKQFLTSPIGKRIDLSGLPHPRQANSSVTTNLDRVIMKCLAQGRNDSYKSPQEVANAFRAI